MPASPSTVPSARPEHEQPVRGVRFVQRRGGERRAQEVVDHEVRPSGSARARRRPRPSASTLIATRIGSARSAIACAGPGKPTSVSSSSPVAGLRGTSAWCRWPRFELARLRHRLAVEGAEDHAERVDRGQQRARRSRPRTAPSASRRARAVTSRMSSLEKKPENGGIARQREAADDEAAVGERHRLAEAAHPVQRLLAGHRADQRAGGHEQQRLEERVGHQVEQAGRVGADGDAHDHVADLGHRRVGDHALDVRLGEADRAGDQERRRAHDRARRPARRARARTACACARSGTRRR